MQYTDDSMCMLPGVFNNNLALHKSWYLWYLDKCCQTSISCGKVATSYVLSWRREWSIRLHHHDCQLPKCSAALFRDTPPVVFLMMASYQSKCIPTDVKLAPVSPASYSRIWGWRIWSQLHVGFIPTHCWVKELKNDAELCSQSYTYVQR